jgi:hypothetical protein
MDMQAAAALGTFASATAGACAILVALHTYRRQTNAQLFMAYTQRYQQIMDSFPEGCRGSRLMLDGDPPPECEPLSLAVLRYLNLCSEEFYLCRAGYLSKGVWSIWEAELQRTLASPLLVREWAKLRQEFGAYSEFVLYVDAIQAKAAKRVAVPAPAG